MTPGRKGRVGVDFDNTIVRYDELFCKLAAAQGLLPEPGMSKQRLRDHLRRIGREAAWTALQGEAYGPAIEGAAPFPGALEFLRRCVKEGVPVCIISHKTLHPFIGPKHDLHAAATRWLESHGVFDPARVGLPRSEVYFELTKPAKLKRIAQAGCSAFIDDLPEFLLEPSFPAGTRRILFDPEGLYEGPKALDSARSWAEIDRWILDKTS